MARRITQENVVVAVTNTDSPKLRLTQENVIVAAINTDAPKLRVTHINVIALVRVNPAINPAVINNPLIV